MLASVDNKFVLLLQQKTGTTSLQRVMRPYSEFHVGGKPEWRHLDYQNYKLIFGDYFERNGCEVFGVVRDPISHMKSIYRFRTRKGAEPDKSTRDKTFAEFAEAWQQDQVPAFAQYRLPSLSFRTADGGLAPISYFRYEDIAELCALLADRVGAPITLPVLNVSPKLPIEYDWDALRNTARMQAEYAFYNALEFRRYQF